jgi:hypothetical protein
VSAGALSLHSCRAEVSVTPSGALLLDGELEDAGEGRALSDAFARGSGHAVLYLAGLASDAALAPSLGYFRGFGRRFLGALAQVPELESARKRLVVPAPGDEALGEILAAAPPLRGGEMLGTEALERLWRQLEAAAISELASFDGPVAQWLHDRIPELGVVGRVVFHLAENKRDSERPFAFLATYATGLSGRGNVQHAPLGRALEEYAGAQNRQALLALLSPVQRAAEASPLVRRLVDSGDVFHPLAWTAAEAHAFLSSLPELESSGVVVRVPDWWNSRRPPRPVVSATIGRAGPSRVGLDALLDFSLEVTLDGETLSAAELAALSGGSDGLVRLKGRWVEIDRERLEQALAHWKQAQRAANQGVSFFEAMRMLAGARLEDARAGAEASGAAPPSEWSDVVAGDWLRERLAELRHPERSAGADPGAALRAELRPYQTAGVRWLWTLRELGLGGCLADDMGLGKTLQVLGLIALCRKSAERRPSLVVAPASLLANWRAEAERFAPDLAVLIAHSSALARDQLAQLGERELGSHDLVVTSYGTLLEHERLREARWDIVALDEAQAIKNPAAKQTRATKALRARCRIALTGTPIENRLSDLWSIYDFACPGLLGSQKRFASFVKRLEARRDDEGHAPLRRLVAPYLLRRLKTDKSVIRDLPDKTELVAYCPLTRAQARLYQRAIDDLRRDLAAAEGMQRRGLVLASLLRFKQICNHPSQWLGDGRFEPDASGKLGRLRELCEPIRDRQDKLLVFTQFRELTRPLANFLAGVFGREGLVLDGTTAVRRRAALVAQFQDELGPPFFVISLKAGGSGLNLTGASHVIHFDRWWNPAVENQATDRAFRIGQKKSVFVHKLVCRGTIEERIAQMIEDKQKLASDVLAGGAEALLTELGDDELLRLVALDLDSALDEEE